MCVCIYYVCIYSRLRSLLTGTTNAVALEAASTLLWVAEFSHSEAKEASDALVKILLSEKDVNIRLVLLDLLTEVSKRCPGVAESFVVDVLRGQKCCA